MFKKVKEQRDFKTNELTGYLVDGMIIPLNEDNRHYKELQKWLKVNAAEPAFSLEELKGFKISELYSSYAKANREDIEFKSKLFAAKESDRALLAQVLSVGFVPDDFYWRSKDNTNVPMTYEDIQQLGGLLLSRGQANFDKLQTLKAKVKAAKSKSALTKIKW